MSKFLVTGGAGFIGSNIVERLLKEGNEVRVIDNLSTGRFGNIQEFIKDIDFVCGDLTNYETVLKAVKGVDFILHQAAIPSVAFSVVDPVSSNHSMVTATVNLFKAAVEDGNVRRIVQASSSAVYGNDLILPKKEEMILEPLSPYAAAKMSQEYYGKAFYNAYGLEIVSLRYFNVFGPRQDPNSYYSAVIPKFISLMIRGERPTIYGDGLTSRDFIYVDNIVEANILASSCNWTGNTSPINIGCGKRYTLNELVQYLNRALDLNIEARFEDERIGDIKHSVSDISKAEKILGYCVKVDFFEGLVRLINKYRKHYLGWLY